MDTPQPAPSPLRALAITGVLFLPDLTTTLLATALPQIAASFHRPAADLSLALIALLLCTALTLPIGPRLAGRSGPRTILLASLAIFVGASIGCGSAGKFWQLVIPCTTLGFAGGLLTSVGQTVLLGPENNRHTPQAERLVTWSALIAPILGAVLAGVITTTLTWRWNFLLPVAAGLLLAIPIAFLASNTSHPHPAPRRPPAPFRLRAIAASTGGIGLLYQACAATTPLLLLLMFQVAYRLTAASAGLLLAVYFAGTLFTRLVTPAILRRIRPRTLLAATAILLAASLLWCGWLSPFVPRDVLVLALFAAGGLRSLLRTTLPPASAAWVSPAATAACIAAAALLLHLLAARHGNTPTITDFRLVWATLAALTLLATPWLLRPTPPAQPS